MILPKNFTSKYEVAIGYAVLAVQYISVMLFSDGTLKPLAKEYVNIWFYDFFMALPIAFVTLFPIRNRRIIFGGIVAFFIIKYVTTFIADPIYWNTVISLVLANKYLLFDYSKEEAKAIGRRKIRQILIAFALIFITIFLEKFLEAIGATKPITYSDGSKVMTVYGRIVLFGLYYGTLAYFEYRHVKKEEENS